MTVLRRFCITALLAASALLASCGSEPTRVLFLGNSLIYVGNLPAVFTQMCHASHAKCTAEMIAQGGATLTERVEDHSIDRATKDGRKFDYLVLQERGGDYIWIPSRPTDRTRANEATAALATQGVGLGMKPVLLGTYQENRQVSDMLVKTEAGLASRLSVAHVPVSNYLQCGRERHPSLRWMDADGGHPGPELTLLMAALLYKEFFGKLPDIKPFNVHDAIYGPMNSPRASDFASTQPAAPGVVRTVAYDKAALEAVTQLVLDPCK